MRHFAIALLAALAVVGCSNYDNNRAVMPTGNPAASVGSSSMYSDPGASAGRSDTITSGSASNAASGSTVTQHASPGVVR